MTKLLVVDDKKQDRCVLQTLLIRHGYDVILAADGAEALEKARDNPPDMIITDILMPGMDGYALCRQWKRDEKLKGIPFVFCTASYTDPKDKQLALSMGAERFIVKPQEHKAFLDMIEEVIEAHKAGRLTAPREPVLEETVYLKEYNEAIIRKLEDKLVELESAKASLEREVAEHKRTEESLRENEQKFEAIYEGSNDAVMLLTKEGFFDCNPRALEMFGFKSKEEFTRVHAGDISPATQPNGQPSFPAAQEHIEAAYRQGYQRFEWVYRRTSGECFSADVVLSAFNYAGTRVLQATVRDMTERKRAEHDLLASETRYRRFFESARDGILILDAGTGKIMDVNLFIVDLLGFEHNYFLGKKLWEIGLFKDIAASEAAFLELQEKGYIRYENLPLETRNGRRIEVEFVSNVYPVNSTTVIQCNIRDITERRRAEEERRRLDMAVNQAAESIIITDGQGVIQYANPAFERMAGYSREELMGRNVATLPSAEHHTVCQTPTNCDSTLDCEVLETLGRGEVWRGRIVTRRKDGSEFTAETSISPVRDSAGNIVSRVAISRDITNEILMESRVRQAQKMEAIGTLAGGIAHDFNNVLAAIIGYGQIAASELAPDSPLQKDLAQVLCAADRAKNLVHQILTFSRQVEEERKPIELGLIVNEALQLLRPSLPTTIEIQTHIDNDSGLVLADPTQAHQVVMNLCTNAYHAMRDTGGVLTLSVEPFQVDSHLIQFHPGLHKGPYVRLSVGDTGCGMDKDVQERIFEPFFTTKAKNEGTGLGLATVHGIVSAHGGVITVYSEVGKGSTFRVYLPCAEPGLPELLLLEKTAQGGNEHILVLDDEEALANMMERMLTPFGYDVVAMTNSADALAAFKAHPHLFDLIVTDQAMPKMTGEQLAIEVRRIRPGMPLILTTGFTGGALKERLTGIGVPDVLAKPVTPLEMARVVRQVLDRS